MHPEFVPVAFIAAFSLLLPLPWHWRARNMGTLSIIGWLFLSNIIYGVDAAIWAGNVNIRALVWCDISTKIIIGANFALPAACLCIAIHLEQVSSLRLARTSIADKRRRQYFEAFMCLGVPFIFMILHYIVQGHRFDIIEDYGCRPTTYFSIPAIFIVWIPPIIMSIGALVFSALALRHFIRRRLSFASHLNASNSALTTSRYFRLMLMAVFQMFWSLGGTLYALWFTVTALPMRPWTTWADVHSDFLRVDPYLSLFTPPMILKTYYALWWLVPASTILFVAFFSFGQDAMEEYKKCFSWFKTHVLRLPAISKGKRGFKTCQEKGVLPISSPTLVSSSNGGISSTMPASPSSIKKSESFFRDSEYDTASEASQYPSGTPFMYSQYNAIGSLGDLTPPVPSKSAAPAYTANIDLKALPLSPPSPISPPPSHFATRVDRADPDLPTSPRPFTFPSDDPSHQYIDPAKLRRL
ncbi:pheromone receptor Rcb2 B43 [Pholiota molesta]|nr:pheromone receptor Rcb2 B43 [Pholiota molesta]